MERTAVLVYMEQMGQILYLALLLPLVEAKEAQTEASAGTAALVVVAAVILGLPEVAEILRP
jgi:hypothetical protein